MVLTTPDANRTFLTHLGNSTQTSVSPRLAAAITGCRLLLVEGYLWELPGAKTFIGHAMQIARRAASPAASGRQRRACRLHVTPACVWPACRPALVQELILHASGPAAPASG